MSAVPTTFRALAFRLKEDASHDSGLHYVYFRQHQVTRMTTSDEDDFMEVGTPFALNVLNVPQLFEDHDLVDLFSVFGPVQSALFVSDPPGAGGSDEIPMGVPQHQPVLGWMNPHRPPPGRPGRAARVFFEQPESLEAALRVDTHQMVQPSVPALAPAGLQSQFVFLLVLEAIRLFVECVLRIS